MLLRLGLVVCLFLLSSCAYINHGTVREISITTFPPGATARIDEIAVVTPSVAKIPARESYTIKVEKEGYQTQIRTLNAEMWVGSFVADIFMLGLGLLIDYPTGAIFYPDQQHFEFTLEKMDEP